LVAGLLWGDGDYLSAVGKTVISGGSGSDAGVDSVDDDLQRWPDQIEIDLLHRLAHLQADECRKL